MNFRRALEFLKIHGEWIMALIAVIIALATLYITWQTLNEMTIERESAYRPDVVILQENDVAETNVQIKMDENGNIDVLKHDDSDSFEIINISVGTAKNVKIKFNDNSAAQLAKWINDNVEYEDEIHISDFSSGYYIFSFFDDEDNTTVCATAGGERNILYILPDAKQKYSLYVPDAYIHLLQKTYFFDKEAPKLTVEITWEDVQGKAYKKEYVIELATLFGEPMGTDQKRDEIEYVKNNIESYINEDGSYDINIFVRLSEVRNNNSQK